MTGPGGPPPPPGPPPPGPPPSGPPPQGPAASSRLPIVLTVVLVVLAVVGAILLFTVVKPDPDASPSAVVKTLLTDFRDGKDVDKWRCAAERTSQPRSAGVAKELGVGPKDITSYSVDDKGKVRRVSDGKEGTAVAVTLQTRSAGPKSFDLFVLEESGHDRVCGIGSLT